MPKDSVSTPSSDAKVLPSISPPGVDELMAAIAEPWFILDQDLRIRACNEASRGLCGASDLATVHGLTGQALTALLDDAAGTQLAGHLNPAARAKGRTSLMLEHTRQQFEVQVVPLAAAGWSVTFNRGPRAIAPASPAPAGSDPHPLEFAAMASLCDAVPFGAALFDVDLRLIRANQRFATLHGLQNEADLGRTLREAPPDTWKMAPQRRAEVLQNGEPLQFQLQAVLAASHEPPRQWQETWYPLRGDGGRIIGLGVIAEELTTRKLEERRLWHEAKLLANAMPQLVWTARADGTVDYYNDRIADYSGAVRNSNGQWEWSPLLHPDDVEPTRAAWVQAIGSGAVYMMTHRVRMRDGNFRWHLSRAMPVSGAEGNILRWFGTATDIHEQKLSEERLEATVQQRTARLQQTIAELESFSYSVSHDMRAPLRAMQTFARFLQADYSARLDPEGQEYIRRIIAAADRLDRLIQDVLAFSKMAREDLPLQPTDVRELVEELLATYPEFHGANIRVEHGIPPVIGNKAALTQCFSNLIGNAIKFVRPGESPQITVSGHRLGDRVEIRVADNGRGIPAHALDRIFQMFYQADPAVPGTGIGLPIVQKAAERMGGTVAVAATSPAGTTFVLSLRAAT